MFIYSRGKRQKQEKRKKIEKEVEKRKLLKKGDLLGINILF